MAAGLSATSILALTFSCRQLLPPAADNATPRKFTILDWGNYARYFREPGLAPLLWQFFAFAFAFSMFMSGFALFAERRYTWHGQPFGPQQVGYVYAFLGLLGVILQGGLIGRLVKTFGETNLARAGFFCGFVGLVALGFTHSIPLLLVTAAVASSGTGIIRPTVTSMITQKAGRSEQGVILGLTQSLNSISAIAAPALAGFLDRSFAFVDVGGGRRRHLRNCSAVLVLLFSSALFAQTVRVPFVGCSSDGQIGPQEAPKGTDQVVQIKATAARRLAFYSLRWRFWCSGSAWLVLLRALWIEQQSVVCCPSSDQCQ